jgi:sodium-independent sulfate anion transporter 11
MPSDDSIHDVSLREPLLGELPRSSSTTVPFVEDPPTVSQWLRDQVPSRGEASGYFASLFPFLSWAGHYNPQWAAGDLVAGVTIGIVVVPQGMAYALLANLEPQYGLYSSFVGVMIYWIFGTSKDISIGPVAVLSTVVGNAIDSVRATGSQLPSHVIASVLSLVAGCVVLTLGLFRFGFLVDIISITSLSAFMTGSAITIAVGQLPSLLGLDGVSSRDSPYTVLLSTISHISEAGPDAFVGLSALALLYLIKHGLSLAAERLPKMKRLIFFISTMRTVLIIILYTFLSWVVNCNRVQDPAFGVLGPVPRGLPHVMVPKFDGAITSELSPYLPAAAIVMLVEHIAISKSFGRVNNYNIDPSQEMVAIGVSNVLGSFFGAYPSTGSFSRTAIQSKAGVRTPASGIIASIIVLLATCFLTEVFFYIPTATLSAVIIHAVSDLITPPSTIQQFWNVSPLEVFIFLLGVVVSIFSHIENGLYTTVILSGLIYAYRILKARGRFLGRASVHSVLDSHPAEETDENRATKGYGSLVERPVHSGRSVFLPLDRGDGSNPEVHLDSPYPGVFIYRFSEGFNYPNANSALDYLVDYIHARTKRSEPEAFERKGDRPWNNPGPGRGAKSPQSPDVCRLPTLKAIILDFSAVNNVDITSVQRLIDVRNQLDAYVSPSVVDWHIACIGNRWTKRALAAGGFGAPLHPQDGTHRRWKSIFSVADIGFNDSDCVAAPEYKDEDALRTDDESRRPCSPGTPNAQARRARRNAVVHGQDRPLFHVDLTGAVQSAILNIEIRREPLE